MSFEIYIGVADPHCRVLHEAYDRRVSVLLGGPRTAQRPVNLLYVWFTDPALVVDVGQRLITAGMRLAAQLGDARPGDQDSGGSTSSCECEGYPVQERNPGDTGSRSDSATDGVVGG